MKILEITAKITIKFLAVWSSWAETDCPVTCGGAFNQKSRSCKYGDVGQDGCIGQGYPVPDFF